MVHVRYTSAARAVAVALAIQASQLGTFAAPASRDIAPGANDQLMPATAADGIMTSTMSPTTVTAPSLLGSTGTLAASDNNNAAINNSATLTNLQVGSSIHPDWSNDCGGMGKVLMTVINNSGEPIYHNIDTSTGAYACPDTPEGKGTELASGGQFQAVTTGLGNCQSSIQQWNQLGFRFTAQNAAYMAGWAGNPRIGSPESEWSIFHADGSLIGKDTNSYDENEIRGGIVDGYSFMIERRGDLDDPDCDTPRKNFVVTITKRA